MKAPLSLFSKLTGVLNYNSVEIIRLFSACISAEKGCQHAAHAHAGQGCEAKGAAAECPFVEVKENSCFFVTTDLKGVGRALLWTASRQCSAAVAIEL